jgi:hypothetical protein
MAQRRHERECARLCSYSIRVPVGVRGRATIQPCWRQSAAGGNGTGMDERSCRYKPMRRILRGCFASKLQASKFRSGEEVDDGRRLRFACGNVHETVCWSSRTTVCAGSPWDLHAGGVGGRRARAVSAAGCRERGARVGGDARGVAAVDWQQQRQTLNLKKRMSPSLTTYSLPSERSRPFSLTACSLPSAKRSSLA